MPATFYKNQEKSPQINEIVRQIANVELGAVQNMVFRRDAKCEEVGIPMQKCAHLVDLKQYCNMSLHLLEASVFHRISRNFKKI